MRQQLASWWHFAGQHLGSIGQRFTALTIVVSTLLALALSLRLDVRIGDWLLTNWGPRAPAQANIVIVAIDEDTLATLPYRSPIDRGFLAELVDHISRGAPRAIGIDILLDQASEPAKDVSLLQAIRESPSPTVMAYAQAADGLTPKQAQFLSKSLEGLKPGHVAIARDAFDGVVRHWPSADQQPARVPLFATQLAALTAAEPGTSPPTSKVPPGRIVFLSDETGNPLAFPSYPAHAAKLLPPQWFKHKLVLIGSTLPNIDQHHTPFTTSQGVNAGAMYGVKIHAHMVAQLVRGSAITQTGFIVKTLLCLLLAGSAAYAFRAFNTVVYRLGYVAALLGGLIALTLILYRTLALELPIATLLTTVILASTAFAIRDWHTDWSERRFIHQAFAQYVSPALVEKIAANHEALKLGGEQRQVTYIFTDLEGFTSLSERLPPDRVSDVLNSYLDGMCDLFVAHGATIDKIIGDAVVGLYGAPDEQSDHANQAINLALAIDTFAERFRDEQSANGVALGMTRIGLHHGPAVVGNFGGRRFFDYTAIGDTVNTAARLEGANKHVGTRICASQTLTTQASEHLFRPIGDIVLKGKAQPVTCFEPLQRGSSTATYQTKYVAAYEAISTDPDKARTLFDALNTEHPEDGLVAMQLARLKAGARDTKIELDSK